MSAPEGPNGVAGNQRLTSVVGLLLLALVLVAIATVPDPRDLVTAHVVVGVLLAGPLLAKLATTGYRFASYYARRRAYVARGPPPVFLRVLAPLLVVSTVTLVGSGLALVVSGPGHDVPWLRAHGVSFLVWLPTFALHSIAHARSSARLTREELAPRTRGLRGRRARLALDAASLVLGAVGVVVLLAPVRAYAAGFAPEGQALPGPLVAGILLALVAVTLAWRTRSFQAALRAEA